VNSLIDKLHYLDKAGVNEDIRDLDLYDPSNAYLMLANNWRKFKETTNNTLYNETKRVYDSILQNERGILTIVLIGSVARGCHSDKSDVDLVIVYDNKITKDLSKYGSNYVEINILSWSKAQFDKNYHKGIELFLWCVNYGLIL